MNKLLLSTLIGFFILGCTAQEDSAQEDSAPAEGKAFHPTDDISAQAQGGKGETSDGSEAQLP
jgi:hypothetical protein